MRRIGDVDIFGSAGKIPARQKCKDFKRHGRIKEWPPGTLENHVGSTGSIVP